jgi:hypothetical protein
VACLDYTRPTNDSTDSTGSGGPIPLPLPQAFGDGLEAAVSFATTEHFTLQTARMATVSGANGRASIYLAALSSNLIALAFIGQMSRVGAAVARARAFYLDVAPGLEEFLLVARGPRAEAALHHESLRPSARQLTLTTAGMVAVVNTVVIGACAGLAVAVVPIGSLGVPLAAGAIAGAATLSIQRRHQRQATDAYTPEGNDRAATFVPATNTRNNL